jgi:hypothetical protein
MPQLRRKLHVPQVQGRMLDDVHNAPAHGKGVIVNGARFVEGIGR